MQFLPGSTGIGSRGSPDRGLHLGDHTLQPSPGVNVANFPKRELEVTRLAQDVAKGLRANGDAFPAPPVSPEKIDQAVATSCASRVTSSSRLGKFATFTPGEGCRV